MATSSDLPAAASWDDLKVFLAVVRAGSLSRAAAALGLTQPTVGRRLDRLEDAFGVPLVRRTSQGCVATERGASFVPLIESMAAAADGVMRLASATRNDLSGVVRVATGDLPARLIARRLPELLAEAPRVRLEVISGLDFVSLERGDADLAIRTAAPAGDAWVAYPLAETRYAVYASPSWLEAHPEATDPERWRGCAWVGFEPSKSVRSSRWLAERLGRPPDVAFSSSLLILEAAACGVGLALLPTSHGDDEPRLRRVSPPVEGVGFRGYLVVHPSARRIPRVRWVATRLVSFFAGL